MNKVSLIRCKLCKYAAELPPPQQRQPWSSNPLHSTISNSHQLQCLRRRLHLLHQVLLRRKRKVDGQRHGYGIYKWIDGTEYDGEWEHRYKARSRHFYLHIPAEPCEGGLLDATSDTCTDDGEWLNNNRHRRGTYSFAGGRATRANGRIITIRNGHLQMQGRIPLHGDWANGDKNGRGLFNKLRALTMDSWSMTKSTVKSVLMLTGASSKDSFWKIKEAAWRLGVSSRSFWARDEEGEWVSV